MIIESLKMVNFRCHRNKTIELQPGVTAIVGSNGSGKSSILEAIIFGMTGQLDEKGKFNAITVGEASGYVTVKFRINDKEGKITRTLHSSEVKLSYDGKEYRKDADVKELLENTLQINPNIFQRVIVARQGEIPLLFSGDSSIRTAIFQKIFMVPNTSNLRDVLWNDYIKKLPLPLPVEDIAILSTEKQQSTQELERLSVEFVFTKDLVNQYKEQQNRLTVLNKELTKHSELENLNKELVKLTDEKRFLKEQITQYFPEEEYLNSISLLVEEQRKINAIKPILVKAGIKSLEEYYRKVSENNTKIEELELSISTLEEEKDRFELELEQLQHILDLDIEDCCPVCKSKVKDSEKLKTNVAADYELLYNKMTAVINSINTKSDQLSVLKINTLPKINPTVDTLEFDSSDLNDLKNQLNELKTIKAKLHTQEELIKRYSKMISDVGVLRDVEELDKEIEDTNTLIQELNRLIEQNGPVETKIIELKQNIKNLSERIVTSTANKKKNDATNELRETFLIMHDLFNPAVFAKRIIQKFANVVTEYLEANAKQFNLNYSVSVNDEFNVEVKDEEQRLIPRVSGGQEIIIGLCLRLSLLQIFAQNFGFIAIDEGTRCLDVQNKAIFFDMVKNFSKSQFDQVLIIDHDSMLSEVTDHTLQIL